MTSMPATRWRRPAMSTMGWPGEIRSGKRVRSSLPSPWRTMSAVPATPATGWRRTKPARLTHVSRRAVRVRSAVMPDAVAVTASSPSIVPSRVRKRRSMRRLSAECWRSAASSVTGRVRQSASRIGQSIRRTTSTPSKESRSAPSRRSRAQGPSRSMEGGSATGGRGWVAGGISSPYRRLIIPVRWMAQSGLRRAAQLRGRWDWR